jgi:glycosyltransferase involved in cell wall biosynthesis
VQRLGPLRYTLFRNVDVTTAISRYLAELARRLGFYGRLLIIPNGVDTRTFHPDESRLEQSVIKKSLRIGERTRVIITVSRLVEKNGIEDLVRATALLAQTYAPSGLCVIIIGDGHLRSRIESLIQELELIDYVHVLGSMENEAVASYLDIADVFVRPSYSEGLGVSFLEAMAAGVPIVGTPVGGIPDFLTDGQTGLFCRPDDPESIADAVTRILEDDNLRARLIENAYRTVKECYEWDAVVKRMGEVFG